MGTKFHAENKSLLANIREPTGQLARLLGNLTLIFVIKEGNISYVEDSQPVVCHGLDNAISTFGALSQWSLTTPIVHSSSKIRTRQLIKWDISSRPRNLGGNHRHLCKL